MCNRYTAPQALDIEREWHVGNRNPLPWWKDALYPRAQGPFIRRACHNAGYSSELVVGQWGLIPWFAKTADLPYATNNVRLEELAAKASYKQPWARGQRCIIPAADFEEPCWETGRNVWWRFRRRDSHPWGLAGLWNVWTDKATGEARESYTLLTINADAHPIMSRMHKPDPKRPADQQDKRSVIAIEAGDVDLWLAGTLEQAKGLLRPPSVEVMAAAPM